MARTNAIEAYIFVPQSTVNTKTSVHHLKSHSKFSACFCFGTQLSLFTSMVFQTIISDIKTSLNIPCSSASVAAGEFSALDGDKDRQRSHYSRQRPLLLDERYTNLAAWNSVSPIHDYRYQQNDVPQCVRDRTNVDAWKSLF
jgi:hypothetical protein